MKERMCISPCSLASAQRYGLQTLFGIPTIRFHGMQFAFVGATSLGEVDVFYRNMTLLIFLRNQAGKAALPGEQIHMSVCRYRLSFFAVYVIHERIRRLDLPCWQIVCFPLIRSVIEHQGFKEVVAR